MENNIRKLIEEYEQKIKACEQLLEYYKENKNKARKDGNLSLQADIANDRRECSARKQAYIQFKADLKSLIGEI